MPLFTVSDSHRRNKFRHAFTTSLHFYHDSFPPSSSSKLKNIILYFHGLSTNMMPAVVLKTLQDSSVVKDPSYSIHLVSPISLSKYFSTLNVIGEWNLSKYQRHSKTLNLSISKTLEEA